ncbi:LPXTG cell wall anchor domain-containing protein [Streptomyces sp. RB6PN25]|uniref:LPXTG cell wall anchor domain-containing protein n=1 Tax=Streptomyces humicola TaxID=2953240 RepID=A0ABT1PVI6_9ACTN|nr:LAETG motif-containing sortase-dependent surface protein [Streptomyces humicola]MCQ4081676.1 LPXTG cell wall anchor domain-containing protein [Streptomyces humicola]
MISKRGLFAATATGAGAAVLFSGAAFACNINDFSVTPVASCDTSSGVAKAAITVTDKDSSGTTAHVTIGPHLASGLPGQVLDQWDFPHPTAAGVSHTFYVDWVPGAQWDVRVTAGPIRDQPITPYPTSADKPCTVPSSAPSKTPVPSSKPTSSATPAPAPSSAAPSTAAGGAPAPSASASAQGASLAKTGGGSNSGVIAGLAGVLIVIGGGALFTVHRRKAAARH